MPDNLFVGNYIKGKKIVESNATATHMNFFFEDGTYETAPIINGEVRQEFDVNSHNNTEEVEFQDNGSDRVLEKSIQASAEPISEMTKILGGQDAFEEEDADDVEEFDGELGFYKTLQPIPYTDEEGNQMGVTEVGSIQEVPVALGEFWIAQGWAEKTEAPQSIVSKIANKILGKK